MTSKFEARGMWTMLRSFSGPALQLLCIKYLAEYPTSPDVLPEARRELDKVARACREAMAKLEAEIQRFL